jgi:hypothetical protein
MTLPLMQFGLNQRIYSFTNNSANMLMFGENMNEVQDLKLCISKLDKFKSDLPPSKVTERDRITKLKIQLGILHDIMKVDMDKYVYVMKEQYDFHKDKVDDDFKINEKVMYYIGDKNEELKKIRPKWTGIWKIIARVSNNEVTIMNLDNGNTDNVHVERLKRYKDFKWLSWKDYNRLIKEKTIVDDPTIVIN